MEYTSAMSALRLTEPLDSWGETYILAPQEVKEATYKGLVCPVLDYGSSVWDPPGVVLQEELESVQKRAARFVTGNYNYETGSMTGILGQLITTVSKKFKINLAGQNYVHFEVILSRNVKNIWYNGIIADW